MKKSFDEWRDLLEIGHEVEFVFKENKYSITQRSQGQIGWVLAKFYDDNVQEYPTHIELLHHATIDGTLFKDICEQIQIETIY